MNSIQKKRKSTNQLDNTGCEAPPLTKKERPWYDNQENGIPVPPEKERRKSLIGGFLKKLRSSSALKDRNKAQSTSKLSTFYVPENHIASDISYASESSQDSLEPLPMSFHRNTELLRFVENSERESSEIVSFTNTSVSSLESRSAYDAVSLLATPARGEFNRGHIRSSSRSMPGESDLVNGLCNSAIRRAASSLSDSLTSPGGFLRRRSMRLMHKMSGSMADLPEEKDMEDSPMSSANQTCTGTPSTPVLDKSMMPPPSTKRSSTRKWLSNSKSRVFGGARRRSSLTTPTNMDSVSDTPTGNDGTPLRAGVTLRRTTPSSSSIQKRVSSVLGFVLDRSSICDGSSSNNLKRNKTDIGKERPAIPRDRRHSNIDTVSNTSIADISFNTSRIGKMREEKHARLFMEKICVSDSTIIELLDSDAFDAVVVDCIMGRPVSEAAKHLLKNETEIKAELATRTRINPDFAAVYRRLGKSNLIVVNRMDQCYSEESGLDRMVRNGIGCGLKEAFADPTIRTVLMYPMFCRSSKEWESETACIGAMLQIIEKAISWNTMTDDFQKATFAGITPENAKKLKDMFQKFLEEKISPKLNDTQNESAIFPITEAQV